MVKVGTRKSKYHIDIYVRRHAYGWTISVENATQRFHYCSFDVHRESEMEAHVERLRQMWPHAAVITVG